MSEEQTTAPEVQSEPTTTINNETPQTTFIDTLPEDIRGEASLKNFQDAGQLAKSYVHAAKMVGADKMAVPNKNFTDDDWKQTFTKLGLPETADKYDVNYNLAEGADPQPVKNFLNHAHTLGLLPQQAQGILDYYSNLETSARESVQKDLELSKVQNETALRQEFGLAYDTKINAANNVFKTFFANDIAQLKLEDGTPIGNHPGFVKALANMSEKFSEDNISSGQEVAGALTPKEAESEINKILMDTKHPYHNKEHPGHQAAVDEMAILFDAKVSTG